MLDRWPQSKSSPAVGYSRHPPPLTGIVNTPRRTLAIASPSAHRTPASHPASNKPERVGHHRPISDAEAAAGLVHRTAAPGATAAGAGVDGRRLVRNVQHASMHCWSPWPQCHRPGKTHDRSAQWRSQHASPQGPLIQFTAAPDCQGIGKTRCCVMEQVAPAGPCRPSCPPSGAYARHDACCG